MQPLGTMTWAEGDTAAACNHFVRSASVLRHAGGPWNLARALTWLGVAVVHQGHAQQAARALAECLELWQRLGSKAGMLMSEAGAAAVAAILGRFEEALQLCGATAPLFDCPAVGNLPYNLPYAEARQALEQALAHARACTDEKTSSALQRAGQEWRLDDAIARAIAICHTILQV
jgi:hypothetical protein